MKNTHTGTLALCATLLCNAAAAPGHVGASNYLRGQEQRANAPEGYAAVVKGGEARFTLPVPQRPEWQWRRSETKENGREYAFNVKVVNDGRSYSFGLFLWKYPGARPGRGKFSALVDAGQKSVFERTPNGRSVIVRDLGVKVKVDGERLIITVSGRKNVERLFSERPSVVTIETAILDETPTSRTVPVTYEN